MAKLRFVMWSMKLTHDTLKGAHGFGHFVSSRVSNGGVPSPVIVTVVICTPSSLTIRAAAAATIPAGEIRTGLLSDGTVFGPGADGSSPGPNGVSLSTP